MATFSESVGTFWETLKDDTLPDAVITRTATHLASFRTFKWKTGYTPFSHPTWPLGALLAYVIVIYTLHKWMVNRPRFKLVLITRYHNLLLCLWSFVMMAGASYVLVDAVVNKGYSWSDLVCDIKGSKGALMVGPLGFWAWSYYISKYYELLDTVLAILKKKPLTTLHVYHHLAMVFTTWAWNHDVLSMHWYAIVVNCCVHVFMYYYYYRASFMKYRPWWRPFITRGQIIQFVFGLITTLTWIRVSLVNLRTSSSFPFFDYDDSICAGSPQAVAYSQFLTISLLILFVNFYISTFIKGRDRKLAAQVEAENAAAAANGGDSFEPATNGTKRRPTTPAKPHSE